MNNMQKDTQNQLNKEPQPADLPLLLTVADIQRILVCPRPASDIWCTGKISLWYSCRLANILFREIGSSSGLTHRLCTKNNAGGRKFCPLSYEKRQEKKMAKYNNIYHRNDGRWEGRVLLGRNPSTGKPQYKTFTAKHSPKYARKSRMVLHCWKTAYNSPVKNGNWANGWTIDFPITNAMKSPKRHTITIDSLWYISKTQSGNPILPI